MNLLYLDLAVAALLQEVSRTSEASWLLREEFAGEDACIALYIHTYKRLFRNM
jgi:hypothetical protein